MRTVQIHLGRPGRVRTIEGTGTNIGYLRVRPDRDPVLVIGYGLWYRDHNNDPPASTDS